MDRVTNIAWRTTGDATLGGELPFSWNYLDGSDLKSSLAYPNGLTASWQYDANSQLLQVKNAFPTNTISQYDYVYDAAGRRVQISRSGSAMSENRTDVYGYNERGELISAAKNAEGAEIEYAYEYDDIGNREASSERGTNSVYLANQLNQYTLIGRGDPTAPQEEFVSQFDDDGNQTLIKTSTGIWSVAYNGENRPFSWTCGSTNVAMSFDRIGRRVHCFETCGVTTNSNNTFTYDNYLLVARNQRIVDGTVIADRFVWDATERVATRPLVFCCPNALPQYYTHDGNKNVSEVLSSQSAHRILACYEYSPFGVLSVVGDISCAPHCFQFSSEYVDDTIGVCYYNYRNYCPIVGRWTTRDPISEVGSINLYGFIENAVIGNVDVLGLIRRDFKKECGVALGNIWNTKSDDQVKGHVSKHKLYLKDWFFRRAPIGCQLPIVNCDCEGCDKDTKGTTKGISLNSSKIILCANGANIREAEYASTLKHELLHAIDHCKLRKRKLTCDEMIDSELKAYRSVSCRGHHGKMLKNCVLTGAKKSLHEYRPCGDGSGHSDNARLDAEVERS